ncbi:MAG: hypothetical protein RRY34_11160, partial [Victivallaceae bacterium]
LPQVGLICGTNQSVVQGVRALLRGSAREAEQAPSKKRPASGGCKGWLNKPPLPPKRLLR